jgi:Domain of unknown function (DUF1833)
MSRASEYFLKSSSRVVYLELLEISHPSFSTTYYVVRNSISGVSVTLETGATQVFEYYPLSIVPTGSTDDLDETLEIHLGDLGDVFPMEMDRVAASDNFKVKPTLIYRTYRSDDLTQPLEGPLRFIISSISGSSEGQSMQAGAPKLNLTSTGEIYNLDRFPMLRGFL